MVLDDKLQVALAIAALPVGPERWDFFNKAAEMYTAAGLEGALKTLKKLGYVEHGQVVRWSELTAKGREALNGC